MWHRNDFGQTFDEREEREGERRATNGGKNEGNKGEVATGRTCESWYLRTTVRDMRAAKTSPGG